MDEIDEADSNRSRILEPDQFSSFNEDFLNTHKELQNCFSKLKIGYVTEKELRKQQQKALENIKNIYEEVFGENSFRLLQNYSDEQMQELRTEIHEDKTQDILPDKIPRFKTDEISIGNHYRDFLGLLHKESTRSEYYENSSRNTSGVHGSCNKCKAMHPDYVKYFEKKTSNVNKKHTNISKENFSERCKSHSKPVNALYFDEINSLMHNNKSKREFEKLKVYTASESLSDENDDIDHAISKELSKLYNLKDTIKQLEEYDKKMNKKINDVQKIKQDSHNSKLNKSPNFGKKECSKKKVTVPHPFNLSQLKKFNKSKDVIQIENQEAFHANPIPNHVYQPLYEKLTEKEERKRTERRTASIEKLKAIVKPFNLPTNKYQKYTKEFQSVPDLRDLTVVNTNFKAKPVPYFVHNHSLAEKKKEEDKKRAIHIKQRSETLLKQSSLPFSKRKIALTKGSQNLSKSLDDLSKNSGNKQELNNKIYDTFRRKTTTVCQPFHFRTEERYLNKIKNLKTLYENEYIACTACNTPKKMPSQIAERPASAPFSYPINKRTHGSTLRDHYVRQQLHLKQEETEQELQKFGEKLQRENYFFNVYGWKFKMLDSTEDVKKAIQEKLKSNRKMALQRQHEYNTELKEMKERVHKRPLLIEMQAAVSEKGRLEKCYHLALERAGVNIEFVEELSGRYKDWDNCKPYSTDEKEINNSDTLCSEQASEINDDNSQPSHDAAETDDENNQNFQHSSRTLDGDAEQSSNFDATSQCSQQSVISNKELADSSSESTNTVP